MSAPLDAPPFKSKVIDLKAILSGDWTIWLLGFWGRVKDAIALATDVVQLTNQGALIATTTIYAPVNSGTFRIAWYLLVQVADGVSSSAQLTMTWRSGGVTQTKVFTALTGDTVTSWDSDSKLIHADSGTVITYSVSYASNTAAKMRYRLDLSVEQVS